MRISIYVVCLMCVVVTHQMAAHDPRNTPKVRVIDHSTEPIPLRLEFGDEIVVVTRDREDTDIGADRRISPEDSLKHSVAASDVVALATLSALEPFWGEDQTWIDTHAYAHLDQLLISQDSLIPLGEQLHIQWDGGEMKIGRVLVRAGQELRDLRPKQQYLLFLRSYTGSDAFRLARDPLLVRKGMLVTTWAPNESRDRHDPLEGAKLRDVVKRLHTLAGRPHP